MWGRTASIAMQRYGPVSYSDWCDMDELLTWCLRPDFSRTRAHSAMYSATLDAINQPEDPGLRVRRATDRGIPEAHWNQAEIYSRARPLGEWKIEDTGFVSYLRLRRVHLGWKSCCSMRDRRDGAQEVLCKVLVVAD